MQTPIALPSQAQGTEGLGDIQDYITHCMCQYSWIWGTGRTIWSLPECLAREAAPSSGRMPLRIGGRVRTEPPGTWLMVVSKWALHPEMPVPCMVNKLCLFAYDLGVFSGILNLPWGTGTSGGRNWGVGSLLPASLGLPASPWLGLWAFLVPVLSPPSSFPFSSGWAVIRGYHVTFGIQKIL